MFVAATEIFYKELLTSKYSSIKKYNYINKTP